MLLDNIFGRTKEEVKRILDLLGIGPEKIGFYDHDFGLLAGVWRKRGHGTEGMIYFFECSDGKFMKPKILGKRNAAINSLCLKGDKVYDCGDYVDIYDSLENKVASWRPWGTNALCVSDGTLFDAGEAGVYETLAGERVASRESGVLALCDHDGTLYDGTEAGNIRATVTGENVASREGCVQSMISYDRMLFDAGSYGIYDTSDDELVVRIKSYAEVSDLFVFDGELCYLCINTAYKVESGEKMFQWEIPVVPREHVSCVLPIKEDVLELIKEKKLKRA